MRFQDLDTNTKRQVVHKYLQVVEWYDSRVTNANRKHRLLAVGLALEDYIIDDA